MGLKSIEFVVKGTVQVRAQPFWSEATGVLEKVLSAFAYCVRA